MSQKTRKKGLNVLQRIVRPVSDEATENYTAIIACLYEYTAVEVTAVIILFVVTKIIIII